MVGLTAVRVDGGRPGDIGDSLRVNLTIAILFSSAGKLYKVFAEVM